MTIQIERHDIQDGLYVYLQDNSERWYCRFVLYRKWYSKATKEKDLHKAIRTMRDFTKPYYVERNELHFLENHLKGLATVIGKVNAKKINNRVLTVKNSKESYRFPSLDLNINNLNIHLGSPLITGKKHEAVPDGFLDALREARSNIYNKPTCSVNNFDLKTGEIKCSTSTYFDTIYQCDNHYYNIVGRYPGINNDMTSYLNSSDFIKWAEELKKVIIDNDFSEGKLSLGSSCLFIYNTEEFGYQTLLAQKYDGANRFNDFHVLPASMIQPVGNNPLNYIEELDITNQVIRELAEELFNYPETTGSHPNGT
jgi:hypothetical protein